MPKRTASLAAGPLTTRRGEDTEPNTTGIPSQHDLRYCLEVIWPEIKRLEAEQWDCIGVPWRFFRWRRAHKAHKALNERWLRILTGQEVAP